MPTTYERNGHARRAQSGDQTNNQSSDYATDDTVVEHPAPPRPQPSPAGASDPVAAALGEEPPEIATPPAASLAGFPEAADARQWAANRARSNPRLAAWDALGAGEIDELAFEKQRLLATQERVGAQIARQPDRVSEPIYRDKHGLGGPVLFSTARYFIGLGVAAALSVAGGVLWFEFVFETTVAKESPWGFTQTEWGARGLVFCVSVGSFLALAFWMAVEKLVVCNWSVRLVARSGAVLAVAGVSVTGFALGSAHVDEGDWFGWPMLMVPLGAGVLVCGAVGAKEFAVWLAAMAFPTREVRNPVLAELTAELIAVEGPLKELLGRESRASRLVARAAAVADEFADRVCALWNEVKKYEAAEESARRAAQQQTLAAASAALAAASLADAKRPK